MIQILVAISIVCVFALIWVTLAIARHISASRSVDGWNSDDLPSIVRHIAPYQAPQPKATEQMLPAFKRELVTATQVEVRVRQNELRQSAREISANKSWTMPPKPLKHPLLTRERAFQSFVTGGQTLTSRKPPQSSRRGFMQRLDPAYFNKDSGDLTDPYELPRTAISTGSQQMKHSR